jgi:hypothetical protein
VGRAAGRFEIPGGDIDRVAALIASTPVTTAA